MNEVAVTFALDANQFDEDLTRGNALADAIARDLGVAVGDTGFGFGQRDIAFEVPEWCDLEATAQAIKERMKAAFPDAMVTIHRDDGDAAEDDDEDELLAEDEWLNEREIIRAKGLMDEAATLSEAADLLVSYAEELRKMEREGWQLDGPVDDDYGHISRPRPGAHHD